MGLGPMGLLVIMVVVGGLGTVRGPIIGAFAVTILSELLRDTVMWRLVVQGALLLLVLAFFPAGIDGFLQRSVQKIRLWMNVGQEASGAAAVAVPADGPADVGAVPVAPADPAAEAPPPPTARASVAPAPQPPGAPASEAVVTESATAKPEKKTGRFKAWLNADQPQAGGQKPGGSKDDKE